MTFQRVVRYCSPILFVLLVLAALGPSNWAPRSGLGWQFDHFVGYLVLTLIICVGWPRPVVVGGIMMILASLLEALQALTPDRSANAVAAACGSGGALAGAIMAWLVIRARQHVLKRG
jgi:VanZ family protein